MKVFDNEHVQLHQSNASELPVDDESIDCVVTSPPYWGLRDYGVDEQIGLESTPEKYVENMVNVFREIKRVLKSSGTVWLNLGDSYVSGKGRYSSGAQTISGKSRNEPMNGKRPDQRLHPVMKDKDLSGIPWMVVFALRADGWYLRSDIIWNKPNPMPESVKDRPTKSHEYIFLLTKSPPYYYDADPIREKPVPHAPDKPPTSRKQPYFGQPSQRTTDNGYTPHYESPEAGRNKRSVWTVNTHPYPDAHFATFPEKLVEPCILAGSPLGGTVLDPFAGSGTTLAVAQRLGRKAIGTDISSEYLELASKRLEKVALPMMLNI